MTLRRISETANIPIIAGINPTPPRSSVDPKVKRGKPVVTSMPMTAMESPISSETSPRSFESPDTKTAQLRPSAESQKYSNVEKPSATSASPGASAASTTVPKTPPATEKARFVPSTYSARPCRTSA